MVRHGMAFQQLKALVLAQLLEYFPYPLPKFIV
jgi:hypothetical protein